MKELKILAVVVFLTAVVYIGVEPYAHTKLHPAVTPADFQFQDLEASTKVGDAARGAETFMMAGCVGCHGLESQGMPFSMDNQMASESFGVVPPDLSSAGYLYDEAFLAALIKNPAKALMVEHKFSDTNPHPMTSFYGLGGDLDQEVADIVAYLKSIAPTSMTNAEVFDDACLRCHGIKYDGGKKMTTEADAILAYMGTIPPDLSTMIRARGHGFLETFINNPQKHLEGTSMPRVGLKQETQLQVVDYMESIGDGKKAERERVGLYIMGYFVILSIFAYLWKAKVWREV
ncbi:MAG: cytochrome c1 [Campylobacterales bacterium]|nr:cytochrome c1 [Campylobacterales bacterium]